MHKTILQLATAGMKAVRYDFRLAHAEASDAGHVGADPSKLMKAAE